MTPDEKEARAKARFATLNVFRFSAVAMVMVGIANALGRLLPELSPWLGYLFITIGMFEFFFMPKILARSWKRKDNAGIT